MANITWNKLIAASALVKAGIAGAGLALAVLGMFDVAAAIVVKDWVEQQKALLSIDIAASLGALIGIVWKAFNMIVS
ncbi:hypothetical protein Brsp07_01034 [Brucella sp. NBRC 14130]|uniref:hypothetical protein n=1 Tax=Brucella TaxID=234 RepID=UPI0024487288|nr:hypothetical protein [Brucella anthropi]MDH0366707.1 hypothetical protein [Brucella anthropi]